MRWEHPQVGTANAGADLNHCSQVAHSEAWRMANSAPMSMGGWRRGRGGQMYFDPFPRYPDPWHYERPLQDYCMRSKGYQLVPVPEPQS